ncbi:MAG: hypothetical protein WBY53_03025 [Acidobacteriaceae bacterium]
MKTMSGLRMKAGMAVVATMLVAGSAAAQSATTEMQTDAAKVAADMQSQAEQIQAQASAMKASVMAQSLQAQVQSQVVGEIAQRQAESAMTQAQIAAVRAQAARMQTRAESMHVERLARSAAMQADMAARLAPMEAKLEMRMEPMQAEMMARSAAMQAESAAMIAPMVARAAMMQAGVVNVGDPQVKDDLFAGTEKFAKGASDVTSVNLGPDMLGMVSGKHGGEMAHKMNFMIVRTYEYPHAGMYNPADLEVYRQRLREGKWNCFIHTYESKTGESTDICNRPLPSGQGNEMVIMTVEPKELTFIHMSGKGSLADLGKLGKMGGMGAMMPDPPDPPEPPAHPHP